MSALVPRGARELVLVVLAVSACSRPEAKREAGVVVPTAVKDASSASDGAAVDAAPLTATSATTATTASPDDEPPIAVPVFPIPNAPKNAPSEHLAIASAICAAAYQTTTRGVTVGCRSHPPFKTAAQMPDGKLTEAKPDDFAYCEIRRVIRGAFTRAGASQAVVVLGECWDAGDGFASNAMSSTSVLLVEEVPSPTRWKVKAYEAGVHGDACQASRLSSGRDVLLCHQALGAFQVGTLTSLFAIDFARTDRRAYSVAQFADDDVDCSVLKLVPDAFSTGFTKARVASATLADVNHDGSVDLVVEVERAHVAPSTALNRRARAECAQAKPRLENLLPKPESKRLELVSDGSTFVAAPASQKLLAAWEAERPLVGFEGAGPPKL